MTTTTTTASLAATEDVNIDPASDACEHEDTQSEWCFAGEWYEEWCLTCREELPDQPLFLCEQCDRYFPEWLIEDGAHGC